MPDERGQLGVFFFLILGAVGLIVLTITLLVGLSLVGGMVNGLSDNSGPLNKTGQPDPITGQSVSFEDVGGAKQITEIWSVKDSRGYAVKLAGTDDSYVNSDQSFSVAANDNWTISTWAKVDGDAGAENMTVLSVNGEVLIEYNGSRSEWSAWYYDSGSRNSYRVNVSAPNQPGNFTWIGVWNNGTHMQIYRNTTAGEITNITSSNIAGGDINETNFDGTLDETRTFDDPLNSTERSAVVNNPVHPRKETNRTSRIMYDQGSGTTSPIYFTSATLNLNNATWVSGLAGHELTSGVDYTLSKSQGTITALAGGKIDGAPVVFISFKFLDQTASVGQSILPAFSLFSAATILIPAVAVLAVLMGGVIGGLTLASGSPQNRGNGR